MIRSSSRHFGGRARARALPQLSLPALSASSCAVLALLSGYVHAAEPTLTTVEVSEGWHEAFSSLALDAKSATASRLGLSAKELPASVHTLDRSELEARGAQNTQEALAAIPGVTAYSPPGNPGVSYRGFGGSSVSQLFNGINVQYSIAARPVDSWIYDRIEAIGGASSFLYGAGGVGGTLNYITKLPETTSFTEGQIRLGSNGLKQASLGLNRRLGSADDANAHYLRLDLNQSSGGSSIDQVKRHATQLALSLRSELGGGLTHTLAYEYQHERVDRPYWGTPLRNPIQGEVSIDPATRDKNYNSADGLYAQRVQWLRSITEGRVSPQLQWSNTFYAYSAQREYRNVESYRFNAGNSAVIRSSALLQRHEQLLIGDRLEGKLQSQLAGLRSDWAFGLDISVNRQTRYPTSLSGTVSTVNPYDFATENFYSIPGMQPGFRADRDNRIQNIALYLENRTAIAPTLHVLTALRHERLDLDLSNRREVTASAPASWSRSYRPTTGRIGLVWDATPEAALYAQYATAADPPSGTLATASFADAINNTGLTTGRQIEVGAKWRFMQDKGSATLAAYQIERHNIATQDPSDSTRTLLVGEQSSRGMEAAVALALSAQWSLRADYSHTRARYDNYQQNGISMAGKHPVNTPATVANLWTRYRATPDLQLSAGLRHVGRIYGDAANTFYWPRVTLLDLGLDYQINRQMTLQARLRNATNRSYAASLSSTMAYLGAARSADIALRLSY
ncbi:MAG: TonB-dependent receptor [Comamonas sp.]